MMNQEDCLTIAVRGRATAEGRTWARELRAALRVEKRRTSGGWPGTMTEARARVAASVFPRAGLHEVVVTEEERESAARLLYATARSTWLSKAEPDLEG